LINYSLNKNKSKFTSFVRGQKGSKDGGKDDNNNDDNNLNNNFIKIEKNYHNI
jgi:hypothetical protein